ncbi:STAS domain-containing protein [Rhizobium sp. FKY42]|uniref:STAS domain-containing protein n=1 Tax=Rhizobium sp. FKY42 TaxID=2562310 RepID=UPI0010C0608E|nr:STAS domain-containing protein [Rhizobium sp. FKY42]
MSSNASETTLFWHDGLTLRTISKHHDELLLALIAKSAVALDISDDEPADLSFVQLIESARIFASTSGKKLTLLRPATGNLRDVLERGGFLHNISPEDASFWLHDGVK